MRVSVPVIRVDGEDCIEADISVAVSAGVSVRMCPVSPAGKLLEDHAILIAARLPDERFADLISEVAAIATALAAKE
jgi:hypothetical protein